MHLDEKMFDGLAACFEYPREHTASLAADTAVSLSRSGEASQRLAKEVGELAGWLRSSELGAAEERYTLLFDLKPVCTLNLGHHLYGDTYDRGALLAGLASDLRRCGVDYEHDLPDFLPTLLRLLPQLDDPVDRVLLTHAILVPALDKVAGVLERSPGPWPKLLQTLPAMLGEAFPKGDHEVPVPRRRLEVLPC